MWFLVVFVSFVAFLIGLLVLLRNVKNSENVSFFVLNILISIWVSISYFEVFVPVSLQRLFVDLDFFIAFVMMLNLVIFSFYFLNFDKSKEFNFVKIIMFFFFLSFFILIFFTNLVIAGVDNNSLGINVVPGILYILYGLIIILTFLYSFTLFLRAYGKANNKKRTQIRFIFLGLAVAVISLILTNLIIPRFVVNDFTIKFLPQAGSFGLLFFLATTAYTIIKHRLMDIRMVVARSVTYVVLLVTLAAFYAGSVLGLERILFPRDVTQFDLAQGAMRTFIAVIMVFLFQPLKKWISKKTDRIFFKNQYNQDELLSHISSAVGSTIVLIELMYRVSDILVKEMKVSRTLFVLFKGTDNVYSTQANGYKVTPDINPKNAISLARDGIVVFDDLEENSRRKKLLREYNAEVCIPLKTESEIVGILLIGEKSSGDMFNQTDFSVFEIIGPEVSLAIENAKAYEEISRFNVTLRQEVKRATHRLKQKNEELLALDKAKDEFISMASHQLRTPLTAIKGYLSMLLEGDAGEIKVSQYDFINEAYSGANRMVGLINDLLNVSRMDTGRFFIEYKDVDVEKVVAEEIHQLQNNAKSKGLKLEVVKKTTKVPHIWADETKIRQVIMNFVDNALYYTAQGTVTVYLKKDKDNFIFEVHDTGIGVPLEQQKNLFEKFYRADNARTVRPDGTGLGIYLAKRVIEDHGGQIIFHSEVGKGSVFGFIFPLKKVEKAK